MYKKYVIFGAKVTGDRTYHCLKDEYDFIAYCDNDEQLWGQTKNGLRIISPDELAALNERENFFVLVASAYIDEIGKQLLAMGIRNFAAVSSLVVETVLPKTYGFSFIDFGAFLRAHCKEIKLIDQTAAHGGSTTLDYVLLTALFKTLGFRTFLEIGTFMGCSLSNISAIARKCYSISLPVSAFDDAFEFYGYKNYCDFFPWDKSNIEYFREDSASFDYSKITDNPIDMVFIDGDHSYEGILADTKNVFSHVVDFDSTVVVWHDYISACDRFSVRYPTISAIRDCLPQHVLEHVYYFTNTMCCAYIPSKYMSHFVLKAKDDEYLIFCNTVTPEV